MISEVVEAKWWLSETPNREHGDHVPLLHKDRAVSRMSRLSNQAVPNGKVEVLAFSGRWVRFRGMHQLLDLLESAGQPSFSLASRAICLPPVKLSDEFAQGFWRQLDPETAHDDEPFTWASR